MILGLPRTIDDRGNLFMNILFLITFNHYNHLII